MKTAVYGGSFDPVTLGHLDIIQRAGCQYDRVVVVLASNPAKQGSFTPQQRCELLREALGSEAVLESPDQQPEPRIGCYLPDPFKAPSGVPYTEPKFFITVLPGNTALVRFAQAIGAQALVRGLRAVSDFEYEFQMALTNRRLCPSVETVFFMTAHQHLFVSSSTVRELTTLGEDLSTFVPPCVIAALDAKKVTA